MDCPLGTGTGRGGPEPNVDWPSVVFRLSKVSGIVEIVVDAVSIGELGGRFGVS